MQFLELDDPELLGKLDASVGYSVPGAFRAFVGRLNEIARSTEPDANWWEELGFAWVMADGGSQRRPRTPPEVFLFASMGVDGVEFGHVDRAPELARDDLPFVQVDPYERHVTLLGATAADTFRWLLLEQAFQGLVEPVVRLAGLPLDEQDVAVTARIRRVARQLGFGADVLRRALVEKECAARLEGLDDEAKLDALMRSLDETGSAPSAEDESVPVSIPQGWRYVETIDAIGVLAPADAFGGAFALGRRVPDPESADAGGLLAEAHHHRAHPAAALVAFKDWFVLRSAEPGPQAHREMADCYVRLGRPRLAAHVLISAGLADDAAALLSNE